MAAQTDGLSGDLRQEVNTALLELDKGKGECAVFMAALARRGTSGGWGVY